jgi:uncharacterized protein YegL
MKKVNHVGIVLDRSGSMSKVREEALSGLNEELVVLERNATEAGQKTTVTVTTFSTKVDEPRRLETGERVSEDQYKCVGWTALADAMGATIESLQSIETSEGEDVAYLVTIVTDGQENHSRKHTMRDVSVMIKTLEAQGNWTFVFMGCDDNVFEVAKSLGVRDGNTTAFVQTDYAQTCSSGKFGGYKKFSDARNAGEKQIGNFIGK